jgi:hypothetical protein
MDSMTFLIDLAQKLAIVAFVIGLYLLPTFMACHNENRPNRVLKLMAYNVLFGWTVFAWFHALYKGSMSRHQRRSQGRHRFA